MTTRRILMLFPKDWDRVELEHPRYQAGYRFFYEGFDLFRFPDNARLLTFDARRYVDLLVRRYRGRIDGVVSNNEHFGALIAAVVARRLGLPGMDPAVIIAAQHKYYSRCLQQKIVPEATPRFSVLPYSKHIDRGPEIGFPCFVKPVKATYSVLARRVDNLGQLRALLAFSPLERLILRKLVQPFDDLMPLYTPFSIGARAMIAEEILRGDQINIDGYVHKGRVTVLGMVDEVMYPGTQAFMRFEYPSRLDDGMRRRVTALTEKLLAGFDYSHGFFNVEMVIDRESGAIRIVEINPRMASQIMNLYRRVEGCDPYAMLLDLATGEAPQPVRGAGEFRAAASFVFRRFDGRAPERVLSLAQIEAIHRRYPDARLMLYLKRGMGLAREMKWLGSHRYAVLNLGGRDAADLHTRYEAIRRELALGAGAPG
ncbi:MAG: ATP-grasp domain-containing protein [Burkholderiales bacterium]